jgi:hypothetical protein
LLKNNLLPHKRIKKGDSIWNQGGDFRVPEELGGINSKAVYARKIKYDLHEG